MELVDKSADDILDPKLHERWERGLGRYTKRFIAMEDGQEVGFLAVDPMPGHAQFIICEIWVVAESRQRGYGQKLLNLAEQVGRDWGYEWSQVTGTH